MARIDPPPAHYTSLAAGSITYSSGDSSRGTRPAHKTLTHAIRDMRWPAAWSQGHTEHQNMPAKELATISSPAIGPLLVGNRIWGGISSGCPRSTDALLPATARRATTVATQVGRRWTCRPHDVKGKGVPYRSDGVEPRTLRPRVRRRMNQGRHLNGRTILQGPKTRRQTTHRYMNCQSDILNNKGKAHVSYSSRLRPSIESSLLPGSSRGTDGPG